MLSFSQIEIMKLLLNHVLQEKIEFATISEKKSGINKDDKEEKQSAQNQEINFG